MKVGDIVMLVYQGNMVDDYRLAKVSKIFPDSRDIVRSVGIQYRKKDKREKLEDYRSKPLVSEVVGVQRLALLQGVGEAIPTGEED